MSIKETWALFGLILPFGIISLSLAAALILRTDRQHWLPALLWAAVTLGAVLIIGLGFDWFPTTPNEVDYDQFLLTGDPDFIIFCEGYEIASWVQQPISMWSNLAFIAAGFMIVLILGTRPAPAPNMMADRSAFIPLAYVLVLMLMGPGSMFFHGSMKIWGGWFDNMTIIFWAGLGLSYTVTRLLMVWFGASKNILWLIWLLICLVVGVVTALDETASRTTQIVVAGLWFIVELLVMIAAWLGHPPGFQRGTGWFVAMIVAFVFAFGVWIPSGAVVRVWCDPLSPIQGHGFWHLFAAIGGLLAYCYLASEEHVP